jgi:hypothetical protein
VIWLSLYLLNVLLHIADTATTLEIIRRGGRELNPLMAWAMQKIGNESALMLAKGAFCYGLWRWSETWTLAALAFFYALVVWHNIAELRDSYGN